LRLDASGLDHTNPFGGIINCQFGAGPLEQLRFIGEFNDSPVVLGGITGGGGEFGGQLNLDGTGLTQPVPAGGGKASLIFNGTSLTGLKLRVES
jgi:hypothetical protein